LSRSLSVPWYMGDSGCTLIATLTPNASAEGKMQKLLALGGSVDTFDQPFLSRFPDASRPGKSSLKAQVDVSRLIVAIDDRVLRKRFPNYFDLRKPEG
jgi:hypothetical protein